MAGGIYSSEKCALCGGKMIDNHKDAVCCRKHPKQKAGRLRVKMRHEGERVERRFTNYQEAFRFLTGIRYEVDQKKFDARDYKADNPLGFNTLADQWLEIKKTQIKRHSWDSLNNFMRLAAVAWGNRNIKEIGYAQIEDFLFRILSKHSTKSRANAKSALNSFFSWLRRRRVLTPAQVPELPEVHFELEFRKTISKETQQGILDELYRISHEVNPRIWIAVKWLATYFSIRPNELISITEGQIDRENGFIIIPHPKEKKPKVVPLTDNDAALVRSLPLAFGDLPFFRHFKGHGGATPGTPFGPRYLYRWWKRACDLQGIEGVDLYGGTRHSTVIHLGQHFTPEELKAASFHTTNKAFERYFRMKPEAIKNIYEGGTEGHQRGTGKSGTKKAKVLDITKKNGGGGGS